MINLDFFASSPQGTEPLLARELKSFGAAKIRPAQGGAAFEGTLVTAYRFCMWSRVGSRLLLPLARFTIASPDDLYAEVAVLPWEDHLRTTDTFSVDFFGTGHGIRHTNYGALKVKDAIADRFRNRTGQRPSVRLEQPEIRVHCRLRDNRVMVALDLSGESLHRRGYRVQPGEAPLKENLAAAILLLAGWPELASEGKSFLDPMCGTGALAIEAALIAADGAPGLLRNYHGFLGWLPMEAQPWKECREEAHQRFAVGLQRLPVMVGLDAAPGAIFGAKANAAKAGLEGCIRFERQPLEHLAKESGLVSPGLLVTNPPYGVRLGETDEVMVLHQRLGELIHRHFFDWHCGVFSGLASPDLALGRRSYHKNALKNGAIDCQLVLYPPEKKTTDPDLQNPNELPQQSRKTWADGDALINRLRKNKKKLEGWRQQNAISCYRLYDADIPEFSMAIDVYANSVHVQEYLPPKTVDPQKASERLRVAVAILPETLNVAPEAVFLKTRQRGHGGARYGVFQRKDRFLEVGEGGLRFLVNLEDRLDTGLFLDYRQVRAIVREHAAGCRFLNLFGYTGTATVYAAAGGADTTLTVDLSNAYLEWAEKNMQLNGFTGQHHQYVRENCVEWLGRCRDRFDLILLDPPSFSNSKGVTKPLNLQNDYVDLVRQAAARLSRDGMLLFSTNFQRFKMDETELSPFVHTHDVSQQTLPPDFARNPKIHRCWMMNPVGKNRI